MVKTYVIGPMPTNCYIFTDENTGVSAVIDPAYPSKNLLSTLKNMNVQYIFITHAHADHIMGLNAVKEQTGAKIVCHKNAGTKLLSEEDSLYCHLQSMYMQPFTPIKADILVNDGDKIKVGDTQFEVMHTMGHTDDSVCFVSDSIIFSGDTVFNQSYGRTDLPTGNSTQLIQSFERLFNIAGDRAVYPGHSDSTTLSFERKYNPIVAYLHAE